MMQKRRLLLLMLLFVAFGMGGQRTLSPVSAAPIVDFDLDAAGPGITWSEAELMSRYDRVLHREAQAEQLYLQGNTTATAQWTVLVYVAADNDLERFALGDLNEMEFIGSTPEVNIVAQVDRSDKYTSDDGNWSETRRYRLEFDPSLGRINSPVLDILGETNTGDPQTLVDFAQWGIENYPAQNYALIVWNHGGSWYGAATDDSAEGDELTLPELDTALSQITAFTEDNKLEFIGFDACLMGAMEIYQTLSPYGRYAIASPELVPGFGWNYLDFLLELTLDPSMNGDALGRQVVDTFMSFYTSVQTNYDVFSLGVVNLTQAALVDDALETFFEVVELDPQKSLNVIASARNEAFVHGGFDDPQYTDIWAAVDLLQFMELIRASNEYPLLARAATQVVTALEALVTYYRGNGVFADTSAVSIYFPRAIRFYEEEGRNALYAEKTINSMSAWRSFLQTYYQTAIAAGLQQPTAEVLAASNDQESVLFDLGLAGSGITEAAFYVTVIAPDGRPILVDYDRLGVTSRQQVRWNPRISVITDGETEIPVLLVINRNNPGQGIVNGRYIPADGTPVDAQLVIDLEFLNEIENFSNLSGGEITSLWGIRESAAGRMPFEIAYDDGDQFIPSWLSFDENGDFVARDANQPLFFTGTTMNLDYLIREAPPGSYRIGILLEGTGGTSNTNVNVDVAEENGGQVNVPVDLPPVTLTDSDGDRIPDSIDNCPSVPNPYQRDTDLDGIGNACDPVNNLLDTDTDGVADYLDNCVSIANPQQRDLNRDGIGDACEGSAALATQCLTNNNGSPFCYEVTSDQDYDGVGDDVDNCPTTYNPDQEDTDDDGEGDACSPIQDQDGDGVADDVDNCPTVPNPAQRDTDRDGIGDRCDGEDTDLDGFVDNLDNCPFTYNPNQFDANGNGIGDLCEPDDADEDGVDDEIDNCPAIANPTQADNYGSPAGDACDDVDGDGFTDAVDACPTNSGGPNSQNGCPVTNDTDGDGIPNSQDNCPTVFNPGQEDSFSGGSPAGDACDDYDSDGFVDASDVCPFTPGGSSSTDGCPPANDVDGDGVDNAVDNCPTTFNPGQANGFGGADGDACEDTDGDGWTDEQEIGAGTNPTLPDTDADTINDPVDACPLTPGTYLSNGCPDPDTDGDGVPDSTDNCPTVANAGQANNYGGVAGDACEDSDADTVVDDADNCPTVANPTQANSYGTAAGDACEDTDVDGVNDNVDNCPTVANPGQANTFGGPAGDACEDSDGDGVNDNVDNCPTVANPGQANGQGGPAGDACEDTDSDGYLDNVDVCPVNAGGAPNGCPDADGDGAYDFADNCPATYNPSQSNSYGTGAGDACEDSDGDGFLDGGDSDPDNCPTTPGPNAGC